MPYVDRAKLAQYQATYRKRYPEKFKENQRRFFARHPEKQAEYSKKTKLKAKYGLSLAAFQTMLSGQNEQCAICKTSEPNGNGWCVDHDHATNKVRQILCNRCNTGLGLFLDSQGLLATAIEYLRRHSHDPAPCSE